MAPKTNAPASSSAGYANVDEAEQETINSMIDTDMTEEQIVEMVKQMSLEELATNETTLNQQLEELKTKKKLVSDQKAALEKVARDEATKARNQAKAKAKTQAARALRVGALVVTCVMPDNSVIRLTIDKSRTVGALRRRLVKRAQKKGYLLEVGTTKKGKLMRKFDTVALGHPSGVDVAMHPRTYLYNTSAIINNPLVSLMSVSDYTIGMNIALPVNETGTPQTPNAEPEEEEEDDDEETESEDDH